MKKLIFNYRCTQYVWLRDIDSHLLQTIGICYLLPTYAAQLRTTADASTTPRGSLKSRMCLGAQNTGYCTTRRLLRKILLIAPSG